MRIDMLSREYPPEMYGGAGVHVEYLTQQLRALVDLRVRVFGSHECTDEVTWYRDLPELAGANMALATFGVDLTMIPDCAGTDVVHSHTWFTNLAGFMTSQMYDVPLVLTAHSLEPLRPWKAEQLGGGYALSSWAERTAYDHAAAVIAVSDAMARDIVRCYPQLPEERIHMIHNGIDPRQWYPDVDPEVMAQLGIDAHRPTVAFVGRIARQKGLSHFLRAARHIPREAQLAICASHPDTPELREEIAGLVAQLREDRDGVIWLEDQLQPVQVRSILSAATVFVCPSIYEPMGIVNLEAMACETAVVATHTGGIPDVVAHGQTGLLVPIDQAHDGTGTALRPAQFERDLATAITQLLQEPQTAAQMGVVGRHRATSHFSWQHIAEQTVQVYEAVRAG